MYGVIYWGEIIDGRWKANEKGDDRIQIVKNPNGSVWIASSVEEADERATELELDNENMREKGKDYGFVYYDTKVRRDFYHEINKESVGHKIRDLEHEKKELENLSFNARAISKIVSEEKIKEMQTAIDDEIKLLRFYLSYSNHMNQPNFNEWAILKQEGEISDYSANPTAHYKYPIERWTKTNGKVRITITIIPPYEAGKFTTKSTRISYEIKNDTEFLTFYEKPYHDQESYTNLKSQESIEKKIQEWKDYADKEDFVKHLYPRYEKRKVEELEQLLHIR